MGRNLEEKIKEEKQKKSKSFAIQPQTLGDQNSK
jgi:hypothetical protein